MNKNTNEAVELARIILDDSEPDRPNDLYTLTVHEARTLANATLAADRVKKLVERLEDDAAHEESMGDHWDAAYFRAEANRIRRALKGDDA